MVRYSLLQMSSRAIITVIFLVGFNLVQAQRNNRGLGASEGAVAPGVVLVKLKSSYAGTTMKSIHGGVLDSQPLARAGRSVRARIASQNIDISRYHRIYFDASIPVDTFIEELYRTGNFEIVEPEYVNEMFLTPNDAQINDQYYLGLIKAFEAWDITTGSDEAVVAIVDSGGDLDHPDLQANVYINPNEIPDNGIDDDEDGFVDNDSGWDFVGNDTLNLLLPDFPGDNSPQLLQANAGTLGHGVSVAGCASAVPNNAQGIAGVGFNTKILFTKHTADNQDTRSLSVFSPYDGILFAAETLTEDGVKVKIINCSWGGTFRSQILQDIITYVTDDLNCLVIAAAGNSNSESPNYPAAYDGVLSVAATNAQDLRASFSNFGSTVDISAPGVAIRTTGYNDNYTSIQGTSFSSPIVAGAAALVWAQFSSLGPREVAERLRVTADARALYATGNSAFRGRLGLGRLDIQAALTRNLPAIRATNVRVVNTSGQPALPGQLADVVLDFTNFLSRSSSGLTATLSSSNSFAVVTKSELNLGILPNNQVRKGDRSNSFTIQLASNIPENTSIQLTIVYKDGAYEDSEVITFTVNPSFINIEENQVSSTVSSRGRIGFENPLSQSGGIGFIVNEFDLLFEMGLLISTSSGVLINNVRSVNSEIDQDFQVLSPPIQARPGTRANTEVTGAFGDGALVAISYNFLARGEDSLANMIIAEYKIKNISSSPISGLRFGVFADWDISGNGQRDFADWDENIQLGFVSAKADGILPVAGIQLLTGDGQHHAIDNNHAIAGNPFGLYDGYTDNEKLLSLSTEKLQAGLLESEGSDVSHVVSADPFDLEVNEEIVLAFALHGAETIEQLKASARAAYALYNTSFTLERPESSELFACFNDEIILQVQDDDPLADFKWYNNFSGGSPISEGPIFTTGIITSDSIFYVSRVKNNQESLRSPIKVTVRANPRIFLSGSSQLCSGQTAVLSVGLAESYLWSTGATSQSIEVAESGVYKVQVTDTGCTSESIDIPIAVSQGPVANFSISGDLIEGEEVQFNDQSSGAVEWFWFFDDFETSTEQNPRYTFDAASSFSVVLTVNDENGCQSIRSQEFSVVTDIDEKFDQGFSIYPNPAVDVVYFNLPNVFGSDHHVQITDTIGRLIYETIIERPTDGETYALELSDVSLEPGIYFVRIKAGVNVVVGKFLVN